MYAESDAIYVSHGLVLHSSGATTEMGVTCLVSAPSFDPWNFYFFVSFNHSISTFSTFARILSKPILKQTKSVVSIDYNVFCRYHKVPRQYPRLHYRRPKRITREVLSIPDLESVLIIGGCGFLGLHLIEEFWRVQLPGGKRPKISVFDIRPLDHSLVSPRSIRLIQTKSRQLSETSLRRKTFLKPLRQQSRRSWSTASPQSTALALTFTIRSTSLVPKTLLTKQKSKTVRALVYTSSGGVVFNGADLKNADESVPFPEKAMDAYNQTKPLLKSPSWKPPSPTLPPTCNL